MAFETTYEEFYARVARQDGEEEALRVCPPYSRLLARDLREQAVTASPDSAASLRRLADQMDPDLRQEVPDAAAHG
ncbi:hypothetical protein [Streptomyces fumanus]|uniref:hypothetical protein n=1 Tax=Streptomyces fumanus TaxID=67302 RepID=UPI0033D8DF7D